MFLKGYREIHLMNFEDSWPWMGIYQFLHFLSWSLINKHVCMYDKITLN